MSNVSGFDFLQVLKCSLTFSQDSQVGVSKLSQVGVSSELITPDYRVRSKGCLKQSCSSPWELFNAMLHSRIGHREEVNLRLLVVGSQIVSLTTGPSFAHNLGCRCPNGSCEAIFDIYTSRLSNETKNIPMRGYLTPQIKLWVFGSPRGLHFPTFRSVSCILTLSPKVGLWHPTFLQAKHPQPFDRGLVGTIEVPGFG
jgi:hypothetical protein